MSLVKRMWVMWAVCTLAGAGGCARQAIDLRVLTELCPPPSGNFEMQSWGNVLANYVKDGLVDYENLAEHRQSLDAFLCELSRKGPKTHPHLFPSSGHRLAYWINAYNALALAAALEQYPTDSVYRQWQDFEGSVLCIVDGEPMTLKQVRHRAWQEGRGDPRVLLTLAAPALGCPKLINEPYETEKLNKQLRLAVQRAINDERLVKVNHARKTLEVCRQIYDQRQRYVDLYRATFHTDAGNLVNALMVFAMPMQRDLLNRAIGYKVALLQFDDKLNLYDPLGGL